MTTPVFIPKKQPGNIRAANQWPGRPGDLFQVHDARLDPRFRENPLVTGDPNVCFVKADKHSIDGFQKDEERLFRLHHFDLSAPSVLYLFSDGFQGQFGGPAGGKFTGKRLRDLLHTIHDQPLQQQQLLAGIPLRLDGQPAPVG